jgi:hypothetical protein
MNLKSRILIYCCCLLCCIASCITSRAQSINIHNDSKQKKLTFGNANLRVTLDYNRKAVITAMEIKGQAVIESNDGMYSAIRTTTVSYSTLALAADPVVQVTNNTIRINGIAYGDRSFTINETWVFSLQAGNIKFDIDRTLSKAILAEQVGFPVCNFKNMQTWEGAYQDYGGLAWFYLFNKQLDTYGVHSSTSRFWNTQTGNGLTIAVEAPGKQVAMDYSRTQEDRLAFTIAVAPKELTPRFDSGTNRRRFVRDRADVWAPFAIDAGKTSQHLIFSYFDCKQQFDRGQLTGIDGAAVGAVLNTIARIGVIDKEHFGGNSWHTPYGPICLHEQYIAQMGLAINDPGYIKGYTQCLDFYRDNAIRPDGHVWARWAYTNEDMMPGEVTDKGFYEAQWGYLLDANPDYVTNVAELYDQTGNAAWVKTHQQSCEKALDWIIQRDRNNNGLVEMMTDNHTQKKGSDWLDIIWASYENAFVNAKLYHALVLWADVERQLGNIQRQKYYQQFAEKLKATFNKPIAEGGCWDNEKQCYIHWREKDGSTHGNNMVTPVNFMAIAYGICNDDARKKNILDAIETQMQKENLFFWPVCMYSYSKGEGNDWQFPFPNYENGDIFLSWGSLAVKAYASYKPELALKYVKNVLAQYKKDGLAFQRYGRAKQDGRGDDILSGNSLSVVGLYQAIYGINPLYNRFYLDPHITKDLAGTQLKYNYRGQLLTIDLDMNRYAVSDAHFRVTAPSDFGFFSRGSELSWFKGNANKPALQVKTISTNKLEIAINQWDQEQFSWTQSSGNASANKLTYQINDLIPNSDYSVMVNGKILKQVKSNPAGSLTFDYKTTNVPETILISKYKASTVKGGAPKIVNIVNFIRLLEPRDPAITQDVLYQTVVKQVEMMKQYKLGGTFLLQYDALMDARYQTLLKKLPTDSFEIGGWWEIPQPLVEKAGLKWRGRYPWDWHANIGFSTGYTPEERKKLIDVYMADFKNIFGYYPKSVASWFIDAYSLNYMYEKYHIVASANCKDQYGTDGYTLWGGYWNQAYYPSKVNAYMPAQHAQNQIPVPVFRMLGSDPVRQYDNGLGTTRQGVVTLEPVYQFGGGDSTWVHWFFESFTNDPSLGFNYTQAGQENSFTWDAMSKGFAIQLPLIARLRDQQAVRVETLEASGRWFRKKYPVTPVTSFSVDKDLPGSDLKTVWFNSRFYRINLLWEKGTLRIRDIHLFNEKVASVYETQVATSNECTFFTLPVVDGYIWSKPNQLAGLRLKAIIDGKEMLLEGNDPIFTKTGDAALHISWPLKTITGTIEADLTEQQITLKLVSPKTVSWFFDLNTAEGAKLPFEAVNPNSIDCYAEGMKYVMKAAKGSFSKPANGAIFRISPQANTITLKSGEL